MPAPSVIHACAGLLPCRIASVVKDRNLFSLMGKMLHLYHDVIRREDLVLASKAMAMLCEAEDFQTYTVSQTRPGSSALA